MTISKLVLTITIVIGLGLSVAAAAIDPGNPDWLIYRDPDGATTAEQYDQYMEATRGETFTLYVVVNSDPPAGVWHQVSDYVSAFWYDSTVIANFPTPNYAGSYMLAYVNPPAATFVANGYVQLHNASWSAQSMWEEPAEAPFVVLGWDITIRADAAFGETTLPMKFLTYDLSQNQMVANYIETDPAFTINVVPEPATLSLLALGGVALLRRRQVD